MLVSQNHRPFVNLLIITKMDEIFGQSKLTCPLSTECAKRDLSALSMWSRTNVGIGMPNRPSWLDCRPFYYQMAAKPVSGPVLVLKDEKGRTQQQSIKPG